MGLFAANHDLSIDVHRLGHMREPLLVVDNFLDDPHGLVAAAVSSTGWSTMKPGGYPGRRAPLPGPYVRAVLRRLDGPIQRTLFKRPMRLDRFDCAFSMVTRSADDLTVLQRLPHIDIANDSRVAILHYLCGPPFGGTAFYRQKRTGLEQVRAEDRARYLEARIEDLAGLRSEDHYPGAHTSGYERTGFAEARFNRLIVYRSFVLHSGMIEQTDLLSEDPARGRLTATFFVDYAPSDQ